LQGGKEPASGMSCSWPSPWGSRASENLVSSVGEFYHVSLFSSEILLDAVWSFSIKKKKKDIGP
jgi:hypothetical protein